MESLGSAETQTLALLSFLAETALRPKLTISPSPIHIAVSAQEEILLRHVDCQNNWMVEL